MPDPRLHHVTITHKVMVHAESAEHAEKIVRQHLKDSEAEWPLHQEICDCASVDARQTIVTNEEDLAEGYRDVAPWSDTDENRTCKEILKDERDALEKQRHEPK